MALQNVYSGVIQGGITQTGNCIAMNGNNPGTYGQNVFVTTDLTKQVAGYPAGTTLNYVENSANAYLNIPVGSTIVYAELMWIAYGNYATPINFSTPAQSNISLTATRNDVYAPFNQYWHSVRVESYIQAGGAGYYTVGSVQASLAAQIGPSWTLVVAYKNSSLKPKFITINTGLSYVSGNPGNTYTISDFMTPSSGTLKGHLLMAYEVGDYGDGANLRVGPTTLSYTTIGNPGSMASPWNGNAPYNPQGQMFPGLVCIADPLDPDIGKLDTRGTNGSNNVVPYVAQNYGTFARCLYDCAGFDISNTLIYDQNQINVNVFFTLSGGALIEAESIQIEINAPSLNPVKTVNKNIANQGDTLLYTVFFQNIGSTTADSVIFLDTIPTYTTFVPSSVTVNGVAVPGNPETGVSLGNIGVNKMKTVTFSAVVNTNSLPVTPFGINNISNLSYSYNMGGTLPATNVYVSSNSVLTTIPYNLDLNVVKSVSKNYAAPGDTLTYTVVITNLIPLTATSVVLYDTIPTDTIFILDSFKVNGVTQVGENPNSPSGANVGTIAPSSTVITTFNVKILESPTITNTISNIGTIGFNSVNTISLTKITNTVTTTTSYTSLILNKYSDKINAILQDTITYTIAILNLGNTTATSVQFIDTIPNGTTLLPGTLTKNGSQLVGNPNPPGVSLGSIAPLNVTTISFKVIITTIPTPNPIQNTANVTYSYINDPLTPNSGTGNTTANNIVFIDTIPNGLSYVSNSFSVDGLAIPGANPALGVSLPNIPANYTITVNFSTSVQC